MRALGCSQGVTGGSWGAPQRSRQLLVSRHPYPALCLAHVSWREKECGVWGGRVGAGQGGARLWTAPGPTSGSQPVKEERMHRP